MRASNVAAALRMPRILELAGLYLMPNEAGAVWAEDDKKCVRNELKRLIEMLAEEEHVLWMEVMFANGWRAPDAEMADWDDGRLRAARRHKCMVPYAQLDQGTKDYDRDQVLRFPDHAERAGFRIVVELPG